MFTKEQTMRISLFCGIAAWAVLTRECWTYQSLHDRRYTHEPFELVLERPVTLTVPVILLSIVCVLAMIMGAIIKAISIILKNYEAILLLVGVIILFGT